MVDATAPTSPGILTENDISSSQITLNYGAQTVDTNFLEYKIFYATTTGVSDSNYDFEYDGSELDYIDYDSELFFTVSNLESQQDYYFVVYAYDSAGNWATSTQAMFTTLAPQSSPGVAMYAKDDEFLYYRVWDGTSWGVEQIGPQLGSGAGDNIRHVTTLTSDNNGKVAVIAKTWDGTNQEWWGTVYKFAAGTITVIITSHNLPLITGNGVGYIHNQNRFKV
jgi:hypothetical protein